ncbi:MAG: hypothetical protein LBC51_07660 [Treponema sp.]|nr:hypothetical protein [Treponema sp.]
MLRGKKIKANSIAGGIGFVLSFIIGIISGGNVLIVFLRALIFGVIFFVFMEIFQRLISTFLPELLNPNADVSSRADEAPGSRVDISVEDEKDGGKTDLFDVSGSLKQKNLSGRSGSFADTVEALDQNHKKDYTQQRETVVDTAGFVPSAPWSTDVAREMDRAVGRDTLFSTEAAIPGNRPQAASSTAQHTSSLQSTGKNLDPRKMASAIQTILKQE